MPLRRDWLDMTTEDFSGPAGWIAVLPVAATEQHGPHLPVGVDALIAKAYLARVRALLPADLLVTFLPVLEIGSSDEHRAFPGTLTLAASTAARALAEIGESVHRAGVSRLVIANSHGGNVSTINTVALDLRVRLNMLVVTCSWSRFGYPHGLFAPQELTHGIHGGAVETSIMLAAWPDLVRTDRIADFPSRSIAMERQFRWLRPDDPVGFGWMSQDLHASGALGDARAATAAKGEAALAHGAQAFIELLREVEQFRMAEDG